MSQVNLLPPESASDRVTGGCRSSCSGPALILVLIGFFFLVQADLGQVNDDMAAQQARNAAATEQIAGLQKFDELQTEAQQEQACCRRPLRARSRSRAS